jgi:UV DNA damage endonuclease
MHPGQYTVLNSPNEEVVQRAVDDLNYHARVLDSLSVGTKNKIVLHIGGVYGEKSAATERFRMNYTKLPEQVKRRLVIENDDKCYSIDEVLLIGQELDIPVVFDNLHHAVNPGPGGSDCEWIAACRKTWREGDGIQKIHYSQQAAGKTRGSHAESIRLLSFLDFCKALPDDDLDIMLEVKDKNLSAVKCSNACHPERGIAVLQREWGRYQYAILERSPEAYTEIKQLLQEKGGYPVVAFYSLIEKALALEATPQNTVAAAHYIWEHFMGKADEKESLALKRSLEAVSKGETGAIPVNGCSGEWLRNTEKMI